jgi:hypothetical protein
MSETLQNMTGEELLFLLVLYGLAFKSPVASELNRRARLSVWRPPVSGMTPEPRVVASFRGAVRAA